MNMLEVPAWEWHSWQYERLKFPNEWKIYQQRMAGHDADSLSLQDLKKKLQGPVGTSPLRKLAKGKRKCGIIFDDMTRPTKIHQIMPSIIEELRLGGLSDDNIVFIMATGAHGGRILPDFQKKLGVEIPERFLVFNHNAYENTVNLGETSYGTPVHVNKEAMSCDLKITIGAIMPHFSFGFGGGSKMILPGVAGIDSITHNHKIREGTGPGKVQNNIRRLDSEEAARMTGLDFIVNVIINANCDAANIVCGDVVEAHREGVKIARKHYSTGIREDSDIVVVNGYPMANEGYKAYHIGVESVKEGGDLVFLLYTLEGCRIHHYNGRFGTDYGGRGWKPDVYVKSPWKMGHVLVVTPQILKADELYYGKGSTWIKSWSEALNLLEKTNGKDTEVALYPTAAMQLSQQKANNV